MWLQFVIQTFIVDFTPKPNFSGTQTFKSERKRETGSFCVTMTYKSKFKLLD